MFLSVKALRHTIALNSGGLRALSVIKEEAAFRVPTKHAASQMTG